VSGIIFAQTFINIIRF